jgi:hypothetical protein
MGPPGSERREDESTNFLHGSLKRRTAKDKDSLSSRILLLFNARARHGTLVLDQVHLLILLLIYVFLFK